MKFVIEIREKDVFPESKEQADRYALRKGVNTVLLNEKQEVALLYAKKDDFYILPGGKLEEGEDLKLALKREALEEVGCEIDIKDHLGISIMYEEKIKNISTYNCFLGLVKGEIKPPSYTEDEKKAGFELKWFDIDAAIEAIKKAKTDDYIGSFLLVRENAILEAYKLANE